LGVALGEIVEAPGQLPDSAGSGVAGKRSVHGVATPEIEEVARDEDTITPAGRDPSKYLTISGLRVASHGCFVRKIYSYF
jgi:hypothetical protein